MEDTNQTCYTVDGLLEVLRDKHDSERPRVKKILYPALVSAEAACEAFVKSVELKQRSTDRLPHGDVIHGNWQLRCSVKPSEEAIRNLIEKRYGGLAKGVVAEGLANCIFDKIKSTLRSAGNPTEAFLVTAIPLESLPGLRRVDLKIHAERFTEPPLNELIDNYVVVHVVVSDVAAKDVTFENLEVIARFHWAGLPDDKQRGLRRRLLDGWREELTAQCLWPLTGREASGQPTNMAE